MGLEYEEAWPLFGTVKPSRTRLSNLIFDNYREVIGHEGAAMGMSALGH